MSTIPFDLILESGGGGAKMSRISRLAKLYRLAKMFKIFRIIKIIKVKNKLVRNASEALKLSKGTERLIYALMSFFIMQHLTCCLW